MSNEIHEYFDTDGNGINDRHTISVFNAAGVLSMQYIQDDINGDGLYEKTNLSVFNGSQMTHHSERLLSNEVASHTEVKFLYDENKNVQAFYYQENSPEDGTYRYKNSVFFNEEANVFWYLNKERAKSAENNYSEDREERHDYDNDGDFDDVDIWRYNDEGEIIYLYHSTDSNRDGITESIDELYVDENGNRQSYHDRDANGVIEAITILNYDFAREENELTSRVDILDENQDGVTDKIFKHYYRSQDGLPYKVERDEDGDGVVDVTEHTIKLGVFEYETFYYDDNDDGIIDRSHTYLFERVSLHSKIGLHYYEDSDGDGVVDDEYSLLPDPEKNIAFFKSIFADPTYNPNFAYYDYDTDLDGIIDQVEQRHYTVHEGVGRLSHSIIKVDADNNGEFEGLVENFYDDDEDIIKTTYDHDNDGVIDQVDEFTYRGTGEHKYKYQLFSHFDEDDDSVTDYIQEYKYLLDGTVKEENYDNDANGYAETGTSYYFGTYENNAYVNYKFNYTFDNNTGEIVGEDSFWYLPDGRLARIRYDEDVSDKEFITHDYYFHDDWGKLDKLNIKYTYDVEKPDYDPHFTRYEIFQYNEQELVGEYMRIFSNNEKYTETYFYDDNGNKTGTGIDYNWDGQFDEAIGFELDTRGITTFIDYGLDERGIKDRREEITYDQNNEITKKVISSDLDRDAHLEQREETLFNNGKVSRYTITKDENADGNFEYEKDVIFDSNENIWWQNERQSIENKFYHSISEVWQFNDNGDLSIYGTAIDVDGDNRNDMGHSLSNINGISLYNPETSFTLNDNIVRISTRYDSDNDGEVDKVFTTFFNENQDAFLKHTDNDLSDGGLIDVEALTFQDNGKVSKVTNYYNYNPDTATSESVSTTEYVRDENDYTYKVVHSYGRGDFTLTGSRSEDEFNLSEGRNIIDGGEGRDKVSYSSLSSGLKVSLVTGQVDKDDDGEADDTLTAVEDITTGTGNDDVTGDDFDNEINLGYGDDVANAGDGVDTIITGDGNDTVHAGAGHDLINVGNTGSWGLKRLHGDDGHDVVYGGIAIDYLYGGNGNDYINGFAYFNFMEGNRDSDTIFGGADRDEIWGGNTETFGNAVDFEYTDEGGILRHNFRYSSALETDVTDYIDAYHGDNIVYGGNNVRVTATTTGSFVDHMYGNIIFTGDHNDKIYGGSGADYIQTGNGVDLVYAGAGDDVINRDRTDSIGAKYIYGGDGDDEIHGGRGADTLRGGSGNDTLYGHEYYNTLYGDDGNDIFYAGTHGDSIHGGTGDDIGFGYGVIWDAESSSYVEDSEIEGMRDHFYGGEGNDTFYGGGGDDVIYGGTYDNVADEGDDWIYAGSGNDFVEAGGGHNHLFSGSGIDVIHGGSGIDEFNVGDLSQAGSKYFFGYDGNDVIWGGADNDSLHGGDGNDTIYGGDGGDYITGGNGDDDIWGGNGGDGIYGGNGADTFHFGEVETGTFVGDFNLSQGDKLDISTILSFDSEAGDDISQFLRIVDDSYYGQSDVEVRADGTGEWMRVADFAGADLLSETIDTLIASGNIIVE